MRCSRCQPAALTSTLQTVCRHWLRGLCMKGNACGFLHQFEASRMPVCRFFAKYNECKVRKKTQRRQRRSDARCRFAQEPDCPFKHSSDDIKVPKPRAAARIPPLSDCSVVTGLQHVQARLLHSWLELARAAGVEFCCIRSLTRAVRVQPLQAPQASCSAAIARKCAHACDTTGPPRERGAAARLGWRITTCVWKEASLKPATACTRLERVHGPSFRSRASRLTAAGARHLHASVPVPLTCASLSLLSAGTRARAVLAVERAVSVSQNKHASAACT